MMHGRSSYKYMHQKEASVWAAKGLKWAFHRAGNGELVSIVSHRLVVEDVAVVSTLTADEGN